MSDETMVDVLADARAKSAGEIAWLVADLWKKGTSADRRALAHWKRLKVEAGEPAVDDIAAIVDELARQDSLDARIVGGGPFILDAPDFVPAVWGSGSDVLWSAGEPMLIVGPEGTGKSTLAQNIALARLGIGSDVLGFPVTPTDGNVLYVAADRPRQIARSMRRLVGEVDRDTLARLRIWPGPPPQPINLNPTGLLELARAAESSTVVVDSLKDVALDLSSDETGSRVQQLFGQAAVAGIELLVIHHGRKATATNREPKTIADVYGSRWLVAGAGSVVLVWGNPGDPVLTIRHLKQPAAEIGPLTVLLDHSTGTFDIRAGTGLLERLRAAPRGLSSQEAAKALYSTVDPSSSEREKARRRLQKLVDRGLAHTKPVDDSPRAEVRFYAVEGRMF